MKDFAGLGEIVFDNNQVKKVLQSLSDKYYSKRNVVQEVQDINTLTVYSRDMWKSHDLWEWKVHIKREGGKETITLKSQYENESNFDDDDLAIYDCQSDQTFHLKETPDPVITNLRENTI